MPKKPKTSTPLRRLRETIGMTQPEFACLVGISRSAVQALELGSRKMTKQLGRKIFYATGAVPESLLPGSERVLMHGMGEYRKGRNKDGSPNPNQDSFQLWRKMTFMPSEMAENNAHELSESVELLLIAATRAGGSKGFAMGNSLARWLHEFAEDFGLLDNIKGVLREWGTRPTGNPFLLNEGVFEPEPIPSWSRTVEPAPPTKKNKKTSVDLPNASMEWLFHRKPVPVSEEPPNLVLAEGKIDEQELRELIGPIVTQTQLALKKVRSKDKRVQKAIKRKLAEAIASID